MVLMNGEKIWGKLWWKQALKTTLLCSCSVTHRYGCLGYTQVSLVKHLFVLFFALYCWRIPLQYQGSNGQGKSGKKVFFSRSGKSQGILKLVREKWFFGKSHGKVREFYDEGALVVQLLSFSDKRLRQFLPFCIIVIIINKYTHFVPY